MQDAITFWKQNKEIKKPSLLSFLRNRDVLAKEETDAVAMHANEEVVSAIDCLQCGNCCRTTVTVFSEEDISRVSKFMGVSKKAFVRQYLIEDMGEYTTITTPCPFLEADNKCAIYEVRPKVCASFPHTQKKHFSNRAKAHEANLMVCPITFYVVQKMEEVMRSKI